ncbi:MAG: glycosyltransferase family 2 protein [Actinomycetota bacterium]
MGVSGEGSPAAPTIDDGPVDISVIVPAYRAGATLGDCAASLLHQQYRGSFEVIVSASADTVEELPSLPADSRLTVLTHVPRLPAATARNRAAAVARGRLLAFADADVIADPSWLSELERAAEGVRCVAGSVRNGTPASAAGTAEYLLEFFDFYPGRPAASAWHGATCNLLIPKSLWESWGPFPEDLDGGEDTLLTTRLHRAGLFTFAPSAAITHRNRTGVRTVLAHQFAAGRFCARMVRQMRTPGRLILYYTPLVPLAVVGRLAALGGKLVAWDRASLPRAVAIGPLLVAGMGAWGAGLAAEGARLDWMALRRRLSGPPAGQPTAAGYVAAVPTSGG